MNLAPDNPAFMQSRAWVLEAAGEPDAAWAIGKEIDRAVSQMTPSLARLYGRLAGRYGEQAQALAAINRLLGAGLAPGESSLHFTAAELLDRAGSYDEAFAMAVRANASLSGDHRTIRRGQDALDRIFSLNTSRASALLRCRRPRCAATNRSSLLECRGRGRRWSNKSWLRTRRSTGRGNWILSIACCSECWICFARVRMLIQRVWTISHRRTSTEWPISILGRSSR